MTYCPHPYIPVITRSVGEFPVHNWPEQDDIELPDEEILWAQAPRGIRLARYEVRNIR